MNVRGMMDQCEPENYTMVRSGDDLSPGSSQYAIASDAEAHATTSLPSGGDRADAELDLS